MFSYTIITSLKQSNSLFPKLQKNVNKKMQVKNPDYFYTMLFLAYCTVFFIRYFSLFTFNIGKYKLDRGYISLVFRSLYIHKAEIAQRKHCMTYT